jgi:hypothetical protein
MHAKPFLCVPQHVPRRQARINRCDVPCGVLAVEDLFRAAV